MVSILEIMPSHKDIKLNKSVVSIGRDRDNDIIINNPFVSKKHCKIFYHGNEFIIQDLDSKNGTYVNGKKITDNTELKNEDMITFNIDKPFFKFKIPPDHVFEKPNYLKILNDYISKRIVYLIIIITLFFSSVILLNFYLRSIYGESTVYYVREDTVRNEFKRLMNKYGEGQVESDEIIEKLKKYILYYKNSYSYEQGLKAREKYIGMIEKVFNRHNIPVELNYIAFVESYYNPKAFNNDSHAKGMWQFMPETARQYGLRVNKNIDDRTDPEKSTEAAASYLNDLIAVFGSHSLTLTIASYNAGDGRIREALRKIKDPGKQRNFWYLYKKNLIPDETKDYVLKVLALIIMTENEKLFE